MAGGGGTKSEDPAQSRGSFQTFSLLLSSSPPVRGASSAPDFPPVFFSVLAASDRKQELKTVNPDSLQEKLYNSRRHSRDTCNTNATLPVK